MTQLFPQRQSAYTTEKARLQVRETKSNTWVDIHGCYANAGPSESRISIRVDGPQDALQRFESGKADYGSITLDKRYIPFGVGEDILNALKAAGSSLSTDFRIWYPGATLKAFSTGEDKVGIAAATAIGDYNKHLASIYSDAANDTLDAAIDLSDYAGPNAALVLGTFGKTAAIPGTMLCHIIDELVTKNTFNVSRLEKWVISDSANPVNAGALAAITSANAANYGIIKPPHWKAWNGYVDTTNDTASQESAADSNLTIKVNSRVTRYVDLKGINELLS